MTTPTTAAGPAVAAGWYPDGQGAVRYYDGTAWTSHVKPRTPAGDGPVIALPDTQAASAAAPQGSVVGLPGTAAYAAAATAPAHADDPLTGRPIDDDAADEAPFYRQGWFVVDVVVLAGMALVVALAAILG